MNDDGPDYWMQQEQELHQQWIEEYEKKNGSASTRDAGNQCGERFREGKDDEQKQPD